MLKNKTINEKAKKLFQLLGFNHKQFSQTADMPYATVHEFFNCDKNVTLSNFHKIAKCLGLDLDEIFEERINQLLGKGIKKNHDMDDVVTLINNLDRYQKREMIATAIHLNKYNSTKKSTKISDVIDRVEKKFMH